MKPDIKLQLKVSERASVTVKLYASLPSWSSSEGYSSWCVLDVYPSGEGYLPPYSATYFVSAHLLRPQGTGGLSTRERLKRLISLSRPEWLVLLRTLDGKTSSELEAGMHVFAEGLYKRIRARIAKEILEEMRSDPRAFRSRVLLFGNEGMTHVVHSDVLLSSVESGIVWNMTQALVPRGFNYWCDFDPSGWEEEEQAKELVEQREDAWASRRSSVDAVLLQIGLPEPLVMASIGRRPMILLARDSWRMEEGEEDRVLAEAVADGCIVPIRVDATPETAVLAAALCDEPPFSESKGLVSAFLSCEEYLEAPFPLPLATCVVTKEVPARFAKSRPGGSEFHCLVSSLLLSVSPREMSRWHFESTYSDDHRVMFASRLAAYNGPSRSRRRWKIETRSGDREFIPELFNDYRKGGERSSYMKKHKGSTTGHSISLISRPIDPLVGAARKAVNSASCALKPVEDLPMVLPVGAKRPSVFLFTDPGGQGEGEAKLSEVGVLSVETVHRALELGERYNDKRGRKRGDYIVRILVGYPAIVLPYYVAELRDKRNRRKSPSLERLSSIHKIGPLTCGVAFCPIMCNEEPTHLALFLNVYPKQEAGLQTESIVFVPEGAAWHFSKSKQVLPVFDLGLYYGHNYGFVKTELTKRSLRLLLEGAKRIQDRWGETSRLLAYSVAALKGDRSKN